MKLREADLDRRIRHNGYFAPVPLNPNLLLASGAMEGPARPIRPTTLTLRTRIVRWVRNLRSTT